MIYMFGIAIVFCDVFSTVLTLCLTVWFPCQLCVVELYWCWCCCCCWWWRYINVRSNSWRL